MRKITSIIVLSVFIWQFVGYFAYFQWERFLIKKEIKAQLKQELSEEKLVTFYFSKSQFQNLSWYEETEFEYNDVMFDLVSVKSTKNGFIVKCINDDKESELFAELGKKVDDELFKNKSGKSLNAFLKFFQIVSEEPEQMIAFQTTTIEENNRSFFNYQSLSSQQAYSKNIQPPRNF